MTGKKMAKSMDVSAGELGTGESGAGELTSMHLCVYPATLFSMGIHENNDQVTQVLEKFTDVFEVPKELPPHRPHDHRIVLQESTQPVNIRPYRHPLAKKVLLRAWFRSC